MPSFFIIGVQKSATSFIHSILSQDKNISLPYRKETHFFSINNKKGLNWYLKMFKANEYNIRGEVDPSYIFYPDSLSNMKNLIKNPKIIILFRKPIDRAFSHYLMSRKRNYEKLSFNKALLEEEKRLFEDSNLFSFSHHSYMKRGSYSKQVDKCKKVFPNSKYLYIKFDDLLNKNKINTFKNIYNFLNIDFNQDINFNTYKNVATQNRFHLLSTLLYNKSIIRKIAKSIIPTEYARYKVFKLIEQFNSYKKSNTSNIADYSKLNKRFIDWNNEQSVLLNKSTNLNTDNWIISV